MSTSLAQRAHEARGCIVKGIFIAVFRVDRVDRDVWIPDVADFDEARDEADRLVAEGVVVGRLVRLIDLARDEIDTDLVFV